jgi:cold shock CspA family protein
MRGTVTAFDKFVGLGDVTRDDGWVLMFHCIAIADGSRDIEVGTDVEFDVICKLGRYEADHLTPT